MRKFYSIVKEIFLRFGFTLSRNPIKYYYEVENEIIQNLARASTGIIHIGAHYGQEANFYNQINKKVIWIEAIPSVYKVLLTNLKDLKNQIAFCALLGDIQRKSVKVHLSNNDFSASSIYGLHPESGFKGVEILDEIELPMTTVDLLLSSLSYEGYNHWILDVQGAELLVLKGATKTLQYCQSIIVEVSSRPTYIGGVFFSELKAFLESQGFTALWEPFEKDHTNIPFIRF